MFRFRKYAYWNFLFITLVNVFGLATVLNEIAILPQFSLILKWTLFKSTIQLCFHNPGNPIM